MRFADAGTRALLVLAASCSSGVAPQLQPLAPAPELRGAPRPFAALYRLDCCGQRGLLVTARGDGERLSLAVASGPVGTVTEVWVTGDGGLGRSGRERCTRPLSAGRLPLTGGSDVPLDSRLAALLVRGVVADTALPVPERPGWFSDTSRGATVAWRTEGGLVVGVEVSSPVGGESQLVLAMAEHHGRVPGRISFRAGADEGELTLVEWREAAPPAEPAWLSWPSCGATP